MQLPLTSLVFLGLASPVLTISAVPASKPAVVVPAEPDVKLPTPHGHPEAGSVPGASSSAEPGSCSKFDTCLAEAGSEDQEKSAVQFKACIQKFCEELYGNTDLKKSDNRTALCDEKGKQAWLILSKGAAENRAAKGKKQASLVSLRVERPNVYKAVMRVLFAQGETTAQMTSACRSVPVPAKTTVKLPTPHGHPEAGSEKPHAKDSAPVEPKSCQKLDSCLAEAGSEKEDQASAKFKACFASFCKELYGETKFNKSDDTRTAMCDDKGKEAWDILAKANLKAQAALRANQKPHSLLATLSSDRPDTYTALMHLLFAQRSTVIRMGSVCSMP